MFLSAAHVINCAVCAQAHEPRANRPARGGSNLCQLSCLSIFSTPTSTSTPTSPTLTLADANLTKARPYYGNRHVSHSPRRSAYGLDHSNVTGFLDGVPFGVHRKTF
jgi:hypothetical protein